MFLQSDGNTGEENNGEHTRYIIGENTTFTCCFRVFHHYTCTSCHFYDCTVSLIVLFHPNLFSRPVITATVTSDMVPMARDKIICVWDDVGAIVMNFVVVTKRLLCMRYTTISSLYGM